MSQSSKIFFALLVGYFVFTTMRGHLRGWLEILGLKSGGGFGAPAPISPVGSFSLPDDAFGFDLPDTGPR